MGYTAPSARPPHLTAGTTWTWSETVANYPPSEGWTLTSTFLGLSESFVLTATARTETGDYLYDAGPDSTTDYPAGSYQVVRVVEDGSGNRYTIDTTGRCVVDVDPAAVQDGSNLSHAEKSLAAIETQLQKRYAEDLSSYSVAGRSAQREEIARLEKARARYAMEVFRQRNPGKAGPTVEIAFVHP